jgi:hypothetical protein
MGFDRKAIEALAKLREYAKLSVPVGTVPHVMAKLVNTLDNAGVFAELDEQTDYASAEEILAEAALDALEQKSGRWAVADPDPAEWGDTTRADMARHQRGKTETVMSPVPPSSRQEPVIEVGDPGTGDPYDLANGLNTAGRLISTDGEDLTDAYAPQAPAE